MSILTPEQIASLECIGDSWYVDIPYEKREQVRFAMSKEEVSCDDIAETLAAYAEIVEKERRREQAGRR